MTRPTLWAALIALGARAPHPVSLVLGGSAALILGDSLQRPTDDADIVSSEPGIDTLQPLIRDVADASHLPPGWLNGSIQTYTHILASDYVERLRVLPPFGALRVALLSRVDVLLMKVYALRARDVDDLRALAPTVTERAFVASQIDRIAIHEPAKAKAMRDFLDEWDARR